MAKIKSLEKLLLGISINLGTVSGSFKRSTEHSFGDAKKGKYAIQISFEEDELLPEHLKIKQFKTFRNMYIRHPAQFDIPVLAHYHVCTSNSNCVMYAINIDGTVHHRSSKGYRIPTKEANELRSMSVDIKANNIIESWEILGHQNQLIVESALLRSNCIFLILDA